MQKNKTNHWLLFFLAFAIASCNQSDQNAYAHIKDEMVREQIKKAIETHGGLDTWQSLDHLSYTKDFALFDSDGNQESFTEQVHIYEIAKESFSIESKSKNKRTLLTKNKENFSKTVDELAVEESITKMQKSFNTSMYVVSMPFKLIDKGVELSYEGIDTLDNNKTAHVIKASYDPAISNNHSTKDVWWYYLDTSDGRVLANKVQTPDHDAFIDNLSFIEKGGIIFNGHRKSYRLDSLGRKDYLRAEYFYDSYVVR